MFPTFRAEQAPPLREETDIMAKKKTTANNNPAGATIRQASEAIRKNVEKDSGFGVSTPVVGSGVAPTAGTNPKSGSMKASSPTTHGSLSSAADTRQGKALEDTAKKYGTNAAAMATALSNIGSSFQRAGVMDKRVSQNGENPWNSSPYNDDTKVRMGVYGQSGKEDYTDDDIAKMTVSVLNAQKTRSANRDMQEKNLKNALDVYKNKRGALPSGYDGLYDYLSKGGNASGDGSVIRNATAAEKKELDRLKNTKLSALGLKLHLDGLGAENKKAFYEKFGNKTLDELTNKEVGSMVVNGWIDLEEIKATDLTAYMKLSSKYEAYMRSDDVRLDHQIRLGAENTARSAVQAIEATGRGVVNAGAAVGDFFMEDKEKSKKITEFIKNNQVRGDIDDKYKYMPSGLKTATDIIGTSAQLVPVIGLSAINPALGMSLIGTSAFGNSYSSALNDGASKGEAFAYGVLSAAAEIAVEKLAGGVPGLGKGAMTKATEKLVNSFRRPAMQKLVRVALEAGGEGFEEVTTYLLDPVFKKLTYAPDAEIDYSIEEAAYNFLGGFAGSAIFGGGAAILGYDIDPASVESSKANEAVSAFAQSAFHKGINHTDTQKLLAKAEKAVKNASWYDNKNNAYMVPENLAEIFNAGKAVKAEPNTAQSAKLIEMYSGIGNTQVVKNDVYNKLIADKKISRREAAAMDTLAYDFGVNIEFVNNLTDDDGTVLNGEYSADGKTIKINANSADPLFTTVLHESVHALKRGNSEAFAVLSSELKRLVGTNTSEFSKAFKAVQRSYSKQMTNDAAIDKDIVDEEFTSFMLSYLLDNPQTLKSLARKNMNTVQKIADSVLGWFDGSIERYKNMDSSYQGTLADAVQKLQDKRDEFSKVFEESMEWYYRDGADVSYGNKNLYAGKNADNIDVFVTDSSLKALSYDERKNVFLDLIKNEYIGRTARFERNGHIYYAQFSDDDIRKNIFGDKKSDKKGWKAKINIGASGDIFDLFETLDYSHYSPDDGQKKIKAHKDLYGWYYFVKSVQIDNAVYDVIANVRLSKDGQYIYSLQLNRNKKRKASPPLRNMKSIPSKTGAQHSSLNSISQNRKFDNENITEIVGNSLGNMPNAGNNSSNVEPFSGSAGVSRNSTAFRVYARARSRYGLENVEDYSDVSFARADIDARNGREFRFEDNTASSAIKDKYNNSLHLSDNIVFERGEGANVEYGTGRILNFDEAGNVVVAVDSGGEYANTITLPREKVTFVSHNNESTISQDFMTSHPMYERAKGSFDNFVRANSGRKRKISLNMSDRERYAILKDRTIDVPECREFNVSGKEIVTEADIKALESKYKTAAAPVIKKIASEFGATGMYDNKDIELEFGFSNRSLHKSINAQKKNYVDFARMLTVFPEVVQNAVGIEVHSDVYKDTSRENADLKQTYELISAYRDDDYIVPVKLTVKEFKTQRPHKLYATICGEKIETPYRVQPPVLDESGSQYPGVSETSIAYILSNVNSKDFKKYVPKQFESTESGEDIFPGFTFGDADYYLSQCSERMKLLLSTLERMGRADSGLGDPYFKYRSTEKDSNPFDVDDMSKNHILLELYDAVANYNLAKDIADVYNASGESLVDFDVLVDSLKARHAIAVGNYNFKSYRDVFQEVFRNNFDAVSPLLDSFDRAKGEYSRNLAQNDASIKEMCKKYGFKPGDDFDRAIQWYGEKNIHFDLTKAKDRKLFKELGYDKVGYEYSDEIDVAFDYRDLVERFGEARAAQIAECAEFFRKAYDDYLERVNDTIARIYPGQNDRLIKPRKDYFRHFRDMGDDLFSLGFALAADVEIDPKLAGVSSRTNPKSAWASYRQERETKITDYSAVQGFYDYMKQAEYTINIDPFIKEFRMMRQVLAKRKSEMGQKNLNGFLIWLDNFANLLSKKTLGADRILTDGVVGNIGGRQVLKGARILNNAAKTNQVVWNFAVALKQALNLKNSIFFLHKPSLQINAVLGLSKAKLYDSALMEKYEALMEKSNYLSERYLDLSFGENKSWTWKQSAKMLSFLDEFATRSVWLAAYEDGQRLKVPDPVIYADDITRRCSAGRGIGEKPLAFEAVSTNFFLSYLLENNNNWNIWRDILHNTVKAPNGGHEFSDKNSYLYYRNKKSGVRKAGSMTYRMLIFMIMTTAVGDLLEEITGFRAEFDPINDAVKSYKASQDENGGLDMKKFAIELSKSVGLDFAGHRNFSGIYASALSWISDDPLLANNEFFGGVPAISVLSNTAERAADGDWLGAGLEFGSGFLMRGGGAQLKKSIKGIADVAQGAHYNEPVTKSFVTGEKGGKAYGVEQSAENYVKGALFGSSALGEAREYWDTKAEKSRTSKDAARMKEEDFESYKAQVRKSVKTDKLSAELWRVMNETGSDSTLAYNYIDPVQTYTDRYGEKQSFELGEKERAMYQNEQNRLLKEKYAEVVQSNEYKNADDAGKLGLLQKARTAVVGDYAEKVIADYVMKPMIDDYIAAHGEDDVVKLWKKTGDYDLFPVHDTARDKSYEFNGERFTFDLSYEQIDNYNTQSVEEIGKAYQKLMSSHRWKLLSDEKKSAELKAAKESATAIVSERVKWDHVYADAMAEFDARYGEDNPVRRAYDYSHDATVYPYWVLDDSFDFTYNKVKYSYDMSHDDGSYRGGVEYDALSDAYIKQFRDNYENAVVGNSAAAARLAAKSDAEIYELLTKFKSNIEKNANELLKNYIIAKAKAGAADAQLKIKE